MRPTARLTLALVALALTPAWAATIPIPGNPPVLAHGPLPVARDLVATELAFAKRSAAVGPAKAMRDFMDPTDGLSFAGAEPARGAAAIFAAQGGDQPSGTLTWVPAEVFAAQAGDMGAVWGHFRFTPPNTKTPPFAGKYVTVWRRQPNGQWKGIIDIGSPD
jgi:ketosteroid isomerase-like protein